MITNYLNTENIIKHDARYGASLSNTIKRLNYNA